MAEVEPRIRIDCQIHDGSPIKRLDLVPSHGFVMHDKRLDLSQKLLLNKGVMKEL